jgi:flagellar hook-associated protein 2
MDLGISGLASGFDWRSLVDQLADVERAPEKRLLSEQTTIQQRNNAFSAIKTQLGVLQNRIKALKETSLFDARGVTVSKTSAATASAGAGTPLGSYSFNVTQLAASSSRQGTADIGAKLSATNDVSGLVLSDAAFVNAVTAGTFTVNGKQISVATTDTLQGVFDKISTATGGAVTGSYDSATDRIQLGGASEIVLGSATDTSNFLQAAKLGNNGTGSVTSSAQLGAVRLAKELSAANFATAVTDGGAGAGEFKINGVSISFNAATDSLSNVLSRINNSSAGVLASYDSINDRVVLSNKATGDVGIAIEDVTGNFAAASGLSAGALQRGRNLLYSVNGGGTLSSQTNTISEASSGIPGLSVAVLAQDSFTVDVAVDSSKIKTAVSDFVAEYNKTQALINTNTASSTDAKGKVTAGTLSGDRDASEINLTLRRLTTGDVSGLSGTIIRLDALGFASNGNDDALATSDTAKLDSAIANNLAGLKDFFTNATGGFAVAFNNYLDHTIGEEGTLVTHQTNLTRQVKDIDTQVADIEKLVLANRQRLIDSFISMETAQQKINSQLQYLAKTFNTT